MSNLDFVVAKLHGMRSKLYEGDALSRLCDSPDLAEFAAALVPGQTVDNPAALQRLLIQQHISVLYSYVNLLEDWEADVFLWMLRRYQIENLKLIIRTWATKTTDTLLQQYTIQIPDTLALPTAKLAQAPSMEALVQAIPDQRLRSAAMAGLTDYEESGRPFFIEAGIDKAYYDHLHNLAKEDAGESQVAVAKLVNLEIDIHNVMTLLRALFNYHVPFGKIRPFLAPLCAAGAAVLDRIRNASDASAAIPHIPAILLEGDAKPTTIEEAEAAMWNKLYRTAHRTFYHSVLDFGAVAAFYYIKRVELANLVRISEAIRYGEKGDSIRRNLIELRPLDSRAR